MEQWRDIGNYEGYYQVSNYGRVRSVDRVVKDSITHTKSLQGKIIKLTFVNGYACVMLFKDGKYQNKQVHRLVAIAFIPNLNNLPQVNHKDLKKHHNFVFNLEWVTPKENAEHAVKNGCYDSHECYEETKQKISIANRGVGNGNVKLTEEKVLEIRQLYSEGNITQTELGIQFGVSADAINCIVNRKKWKHI